MSTEYTPVGKLVADPGVRTKRYREYDQQAVALDDLVETTLERIDGIMDATQIGCSAEFGDGARYHRYEREFAVSLYAGAKARQLTKLSILHISHHRPVQYVLDHYFVTLRQADLEGRRLVADSYIFNRYVHSGAAVQVQYSVDLPDWITHPDGGPEALWSDATPYDVEQLDGELSGLERLQGYVDEVAEFDRARGLA